MTARRVLAAGVVVAAAAAVAGCSAGTSTTPKTSPAAAASMKNTVGRSTLADNSPSTTSRLDCQIADIAYLRLYTAVTNSDDDTTVRQVLDSTPTPSLLPDETSGDASVSLPLHQLGRDVQAARDSLTLDRVTLSTDLINADDACLAVGVTF